MIISRSDFPTGWDSKIIDDKFEQKWVSAHDPGIFGKISIQNISKNEKSVQKMVGVIIDSFVCGKWQHYP